VAAPTNTGSGKYKNTMLNINQFHTSTIGLKDRTDFATVFVMKKNVR
jgi:hypothetical protein